MCGRYVLLRPDLRELLKRLRLEDLIDRMTGESRYNIGPAQTVVGVKRAPLAAAPTVEEMHWGMHVPSGESPGKTHFVINARAETVAQRPAFREPLRSGRCVLPASGFYEWRRDVAGPSEPWLFRLEKEAPFFLAALRAEVGDGSPAKCVVLTTGPNDRMKPIHDRMPVMLTVEGAERWLGEGAETKECRAELLRPFPAEKMTAQRVSRFVSSIKNEGPECVAPGQEDAPAPRQGELF